MIRKAPVIAKTQNPKPLPVLYTRIKQKRRRGTIQQPTPLSLSLRPSVVSIFQLPCICNPIQMYQGKRGPEKQNYYPNQNLRTQRRDVASFQTPASHELQNGSPVRSNALFRKLSLFEKEKKGGPGK